MVQPFIQFENISKSFGKKVVLNDVNLSIPYKEIFGIIGKSGSGKTTLLSILIGFIKADKGKVYYQSQEINKEISLIKQQFGFAAQQASFYPRLTVSENLEYFARLYGLSRSELREKIPNLLKLVNLQDAENLQGYKLSAGMQKRLDIACAIIHDPKVLILDEPTEDLDPVLRKDILDLLLKINKDKDVTIIITSHLLDEVEYICTMVSILDNAKIVVSGTLNSLKEKYSEFNEVVLDLETRDYEKLSKQLKRKRDIKKMVIRNEKLYLYTKKGEKVIKELLALVKKRKLKVNNISFNKPSLEEIFESVTKKND